jgi:hypothetical protein
MMKRFFQPVAYLFFLASTFGSAFASGDNHAKAHSHGAGKLELAMQGNAVRASFVFPMDSLLGFEHLPKTPAQKAAVEQLQLNLTKEQFLIKFPTAAQCKQTAIQPSSAMFAKASDKPVAQSGHADLTVDVEFVCADTKALDRIELEVFKHHPKLHQMRVQWVSTKGQRTRVVRSSQPSLTL